MRVQERKLNFQKRRFITFEKYEFEGKWGHCTEASAQVLETFTGTRERVRSAGCSLLPALHPQSSEALPEIDSQCLCSLLSLSLSSLGT